MTRISKEELTRLSRRAIVAFAVRCARRVQPLYRSHASYSNDERRQQVLVVDRAIRVAEGYAFGATDVVTEATSAAEQAHSAPIACAADLATAIAAAPAHKACVARSDADWAADRASCAARAAAARAADAAAHADGKADTRFAAQSAAYAGDAAAAAMRYIACSVNSRFAARADYEWLCAWSETVATEDSAIPQEFFGWPLWPEVEPNWWIEYRAEMQHILDESGRV